MSYNGWTNYETWVTHLWLTNEPGPYGDALDQAREAQSKYDLEQWLKSYVRDEILPDLGGSLAADLLGAAVNNIDWQEMAVAFLEDVAEDVEA